MVDMTKTLPEGHAAEQEVAELLRQGGFVVKVRNEGGRQDLFAWRDDIPFRIEVKNESRHAHTGNLCVECTQLRRGVHVPSGILTSESTVCVHKLADRVASYRTQAMRRFLRARNYPMVAMAGADNGNRAVVLPIKDVREYDWFDLREMSALADSPLWNY